MTKRQLTHLKPGDVIQNKLTGMAYTILATYGDFAIAVDVAHVTHANEWELLYTATLKHVPRHVRTRRQE